MRACACPASPSHPPTEPPTEPSTNQPLTQPPQPHCATLPLPRSSSFEDLILVDGRMRWNRLEGLFEEGAKSQDYDPAQVSGGVVLAGLGVGVVGVALGLRGLAALRYDCRRVVVAG